MVKAATKVRVCPECKVPEPDPKTHPSEALGWMETHMGDMELHEVFGRWRAYIIQPTCGPRRSPGPRLSEVRP
jgi:hypothetical protein